MTGESASDNSPSVEVDTVDEAPAVHTSLGEFCAGLSGVDKRVELISGFHSDELRENRLFDTSAAYRERFEAFAVRPVK